LEIPRARKTSAGILVGLRAVGDVGHDVLALRGDLVVRRLLRGLALDDRVDVGAVDTRPLGGAAANLEAFTDTRVTMRASVPSYPF
jgi:hypothetical protein